MKSTHDITTYRGWLALASELLGDKPDWTALSCRIPDDCIDSKRYPLFMARAVLKELIESLQSTQGVKPC